MNRAALATHLSSVLGSIRFRLAALYTIVVFGLAMLLVGGTYLALTRSLDRQKTEVIAVQSDSADFDCYRVGRSPIVCMRRSETAFINNPFQEVAILTRRQALEEFRRYSLIALTALFPVRSEERRVGKECA